MANASLNETILETVNAPYKKSVGAPMLIGCLTRGHLGAWPAHIATFFTEVGTESILSFAEQNGIPMDKLAAAYIAMKEQTGESNDEMDALFDTVKLSA